MLDEIKHVEGLAKGVVLDFIKQKIIEAVVKQMSWFGAPPLSWVLGFVLGKILPIIMNEGMLHLKYFGIDHDVSKENEAAKAVKEELKKAIETGDKDVINKARENFKEKYRDLINMPRP